MDKKYRMVVTTVSGKRYLSPKDITPDQMREMGEMLEWEGINKDAFLKMKTVEGPLYVCLPNVETVSFLDY